MLRYWIFKLVRLFRRVEKIDGGCPRRRECGPWLSGQDYWERRKGGRKLRFCSFCGCLHPEDAIRLLEGGSGFDRTTKSYKGYIHAKEFEASRKVCLKFYIMHFSKDQIERLNKAIGC